jgi:6-phosphogluconate dehydrogenase
VSPPPPPRPHALPQNLALNIASKGFACAVYNRSASKVDDTVKRAAEEGSLPIHGFKDVRARP